MATKGKRSDEGGSTAEHKGHVPPPAPEDTRQFESPHAATEMDRALEELERDGGWLSAGSGRDVERGLGSGGYRAGRREEIASDPDAEEQMAEDLLSSGAEDEDESQTHGRGRRG